MLFYDKKNEATERLFVFSRTLTHTLSTWTFDRFLDTVFCIIICDI